MEPTDDQIRDKVAYLKDVLAQGGAQRPPSNPDDLTDLARELLIHQAEFEADPASGFTLPHGWGKVELWYQGDGPPLGFVIHLYKPGVDILKSATTRLEAAVGVVDAANTQAGVTGKGESGAAPLHAIAYTLLARLVILEDIANKNNGRVDLFSPWFAWGMFWAWPPDPKAKDPRLKIAVYTPAKNGSDPGVWAPSGSRFDSSHLTVTNAAGTQGPPALAIWYDNLICVVIPMGTGSRMSARKMKYIGGGDEPSGWTTPELTSIWDAYSGVAVVRNRDSTTMDYAYLGRQEGAYRDRVVRWAQGRDSPKEPRDLIDGGGNALFAFSQPALAVFKGITHCCAQKGTRESGVPHPIVHGYLSQKDRWSVFHEIPKLQSLSAPALAVTNPGGNKEQLHLVCRAYNPDDIRNTPLCHCIYQNGAWSKPNLLIHKNTSSAPALAILNGKLYCIARGLGDNGLWYMWWDGQNWSQYTPTNLTTDFSNNSQLIDGFGPALVAYRDPYGTGDELMCLYW